MLVEFSIFDISPSVLKVAQLIETTTHNRQFFTSGDSLNALAFIDDVNVCISPGTNLRFQIYSSFRGVTTNFL